MNKKQPQSLLFWFIWIAFCISFICYQIFFNSSLFHEESKLLEVKVFSEQDYILTGIAMTLISASAILRWLVIPRINAKELQLQIFITALAFSEAPIFFALFIISKDNTTAKTVLTILSGLAVLQMIPTFCVKNNESD